MIETIDVYEKLEPLLNEKAKDIFKNVCDNAVIQYDVKLKEDHFIRGYVLCRYIGIVFDKMFQYVNKSDYEKIAKFINDYSDMNIFFHTCLKRPFAIKLDKNKTFIGFYVFTMYNNAELNAIFKYTKVQEDGYNFYAFLEGSLPGGKVEEVDYNIFETIYQKGDEDGYGRCLDIHPETLHKED